MSKFYTVKKLAKIANISVRTLHHYDQINLLKPQDVGENGYRYYTHAQLAKLMQILFYKELDFSLEEIKKIINDPKFDLKQALVDHQTLLTLKHQRNQRLLKTINQLLDSYKKAKPMTIQKNYKSFMQDEIEKYKDEVKSRWGHTDAYRQSMERYQNWSKDEAKNIIQEGEKITAEIAKVSEQPIDSKEVQTLIAKHHAHIGRFYDCSIEMYRGLGEMYFADSRFAAYYDKRKEGLAKFMNQAINFYCDSQINKA